MAQDGTWSECKTKGDEGMTWDKSKVKPRHKTALMLWNQSDDKGARNGEII